VRRVPALEFFLGTWNVERSIDDRLRGDRGTFGGTATFVLEGEARVRYEEIGVVRFGAYSGRASRQLYYSPLGTSRFDLSFTDGHHFIRLELAEGSSQGHHQCQNDAYDITTLILSDDLMEERWRVLGPTKDYEALTHLTRLVPPDATST
jgi:hypothetical protein